MGYIVTSITSRLTYRINRLYLGMIKNETKSTKKCTQCHAPMFPSDGEQLNTMGFCSWDCVQRWENGCNYLQFFVHLTDALMYAEGVDTLDDLSRESRQYWNMVAMS